MTDIDAMAAEFDKLNATEEEFGDVIEDELEETEEDEQENSPPGFKSYDDYVKDGGDPDMYKGKKAYEAEKKRIDENKKLNNEIRDLKKSTDSIAEAMQEWQSKERAKMKSELEAKLAEQRDSLDIDGVLDTREKLEKLNREEKKAPKLNPVIAQFTEENPILDKSSDQFNEEFFDDMARLQAKKINAMSDTGGADLTNAQILKCTKAAFEEAKELNRDLFSSPRNDRKGATRQKTPTASADKGGSIETRLKAMTLKDSRDPENRNSGAVYEIYETIKQRDPKAAKLFAERQLAGA